MSSVHKGDEVKKEFPLRLKCDWKVLDRRGLIEAHGEGETSLISSIGVVFAAADFPENPPSRMKVHKVRLAVSWPATLNEGVSLKLYLQGMVTSVISKGEGQQVVCSFQQYEFKVRPVSTLT